MVKLMSRELKEAFETCPDARLMNEEENKRYEESVKFNFNSEKAKEVLLRESNTFKVVYLNQIGIRIATLSELDVIVESNPKFLKGYYEDVGLVVLRSRKNPSYEANDYLIDVFVKETKLRKFKTPYVLSGLKVEEDVESDYGLVLVPGDNFNYFEAPELSHSNNQRKFSKLDERGMPIFDDKGSRILYTQEKGLSRLNLNWDFCLDSYWNFLDFSNSDGRVVVVDAKGVAPKNLDKYV